ncbi:UTP--glucose-1-phosphate uridylyltransferase [Borrelia sp. CA_690]|uniref:UTP--glucose-1-phosphate uridylyltransferase n=1 Tax=Borrelia maritima TaxID=2761123 RepID=A0A5J6WBM7_9SPIR|nr:MULTISPECIES: UTP--glucose-1-phosphate uridylyltransferase [Borrelia]QFI14168.1 UTP--glucose-1-phosphate uridylyltransferase [Borrelia maritima]WKC84020.1 UTP--glucose-1-phosphate uridylyltransferase [Borrelia sp. CA_690]
MNIQVDKIFSEMILKKLNSGEIGINNFETIKYFPCDNHENIFNISDKIKSFKFNKGMVEDNLKKYFYDYYKFLRLEEGNFYIFSSCDLENLGLALFPYLSFGILNGGSATSYFDLAKNRGLSEDLYVLYESKILEFKEKFGKLPKGITPAYINKDGSFGFSFLALKIRHLLMVAKIYESLYGKRIKPSMFQMTSCKTNELISKFLDDLFVDDLIKSVNFCNFKKEDIFTAVQPLVYCYEKLNGSNYQYFTFKDNKNNNSILALPAGHGQNFKILKDIYLQLYESGKRFVYIGNVDNMGFTINFKALAVMALTNCSSGFEFSFKSKTDFKGGVLAVNGENRLTCVDIGGGISSERIEEFENKGNPLLFNCATGLFNLEYLIKNIDQIIEKMPIRIIEQNKEIGKYVSVEQITWEVLRLMKNPLILTVDRSKRFLPAKLFIDMLLNSSCLEDRCEHNYRKKIDDFEATKGLYNCSLSALLLKDYGLLCGLYRWTF